MPAVFGYGSLVAAGGRVATLPGHRRTWGVAMDNAAALPGYKRYRDPVGGGFPDVRVTFLDLAADARSSVDGVVLEVSVAALEELDARERNYVRERVALADGTRPWCYVGSAEGRARTLRPPVVVARGYLDLVREAHAALGSLARFDASTDPPPEVRELVREELGPG